MAFAPFRAMGLALERFARTGTTSGFRNFQTVADSVNAPLCDEHGRLLVRAVGASGIIDQGVGASTPKYIRQTRGSAPAQDNLGLIENTRLMARPNDIGLAGIAGTPQIGQLFGYCEKAGFIQVILMDESGGVNPPVGGEVPEIIIPIGAEQNFIFSDYQLSGNTLDLATYLTFSKDGPTFDPNGDELWFYFAGMV